LIGEQHQLRIVGWALDQTGSDRIGNRLWDLGRVEAIAAAIKVEKIPP
jgi:hypothetical protein